MREKSRHPGSGISIDQAVDRAVRKRLAKLSNEDVLANLKAQGIDSLEKLVSESLQGVKDRAHLGGGVVARDTFIYTQAIYKTAMPADSELWQEVAQEMG
jgi:hypothetical protein